MSMKYVVEYGSTRIRFYECERESPKFAWLKLLHVDGTFKLKKADQVFDTWSEAHAELTRRAKARLAEAQDFAAEVRGMKPPQEVQ